MLTSLAPSPIAKVIYPSEYCLYSLTISYFCFGEVLEKTTLSA